MKKLFFPLLSLCLLTTACKDSVPSPTIEMQGLYVNDGEMIIPGKWRPYLLSK